MSVEIQDFVDVIVPVLEAGTWTNLGHTPQVVGKNLKSGRHAKNERIDVKNQPGSTVHLNYDGSINYTSLRGAITLMSTDGTDRNYMKSDVLAILKSAGIPFTEPSIDDNPKIRNKQTSTFLLEIITC